MIFGCPIRVKHIPRIAGDQIRRVIACLSNRRMAKIHFVYFSCGRDMPLLTLSLKSLMAIKATCIGSIFVVVDSKGPFSLDQEIALKRICPRLQFLSLGQIDWASIATLHTELRAFSTAARGVDAIDFIAKVDSDILFFSEKKLNEISICQYDFVGDGHYSDYFYAQGGLYFIRAEKALPLSETVNDDELNYAIKLCGSVSEDRVMSMLFSRRSYRIWMTRLMLFPNEYEKSDLRNSWLQREFSAIHFVRRKNDMPSYAKIIGIDQEII